MPRTMLRAYLFPSAFALILTASACSDQLATENIEADALRDLMDGETVTFPPSDGVVPAFDNSEDLAFYENEDFCSLARRSEHFIYGRVVSLSMTTDPFVIVDYEESAPPQWGASTDACAAIISPSLEVSVQARSGERFQVLIGGQLFARMDPFPIPTSLTSRSERALEFTWSDTLLEAYGSLDPGEYIGVFLSRYGNQYQDESGVTHAYIEDYPDTDYWYLSFTDFFVFNSEKSTFMTTQPYQRLYGIYSDMEGLTAAEVEAQLLRCREGIPNLPGAPGTPPLGSPPIATIFPTCSKK
jgi:hypothetical protein